jgi:hypothetical protein
MKAQLNAQIASAEQENARVLAELNAQITKYKADLDAQTKLTIAQMGAEQAAAQHEQAESSKLDLSPIQDTLSKLMEQANAPVEIIRGPDGRASGIRKGSVTKSINRGSDGRAMGVS